MRPTKHEYYLKLAADVAARSTCVRRQYGAVLVKDDEIVATGYNGAARGEPNCCDTDFCARRNAEHNTGYTSACPAVHAEMNALLSAGRARANGATLYLAGFDRGVRIEDPEPCEMCRRMIITCGVKQVRS